MSGKLNKLEKYLKPSYLCESNSPEIIRAVKKLRNKKRKEAVKKIFEWVRDNIPYRIEKVKSAVELLKEKNPSGMCVSKTNLFIAMCRAIGVPARYLVTIHTLRLKENSVRTFHLIAEVFLDGKWLPADPSFGKHSMHIIPISKFGEIDEKNTKKLFRLAGLSRSIVLIINLLYKFSPSVRKIVKFLDVSFVSHQKLI